MRTSYLFRRAAAALLCLMIGAVCLSQPVLAYDPIPNTDEPCTLRLEYKYANVTFDVYYVASVKKDITFDIVPDFADVRADFANLDKDGWTALATTLSIHADVNHFRPLHTLVTDEDGYAEVDDLPTGLYLVVGRKHIENVRNKETGVLETLYVQPTSFLVCLPNWDSTQGSAASGSGEWSYDVTVRPKPGESKDDKIWRRVLKVWDDAGNRANRPKEITVWLLRDGERWYEITLNRNNKWFMDFPDLDNQHEWKVIEWSIDGEYSVSYDTEGATLVIENSWYPDRPHNDPDDPPPPPDDPELPPIEFDDPPVPLAPPPEDDPPEEEEFDDWDVPLSELPQTGQLWWPVPILALAGMFLFLVGWIFHRRGRLDEE